MQLRLIRFGLLILLLVNLIHVEGNYTELPHVAVLTPNPVAIPFQQASSSRKSDEKNSDISYHRSALDSAEIGTSFDEKYREIKRAHRRRDMTKGFGGNDNVGTVPSSTRSIISSPFYSTTHLAEKLAQEALSSKEMQDTIKDLTSLKNGRKQLHRDMSQENGKELEPAAPVTHLPKIEVTKPNVRNEDHPRHKGHKNRKHKKHRKHHKHHHQEGRAKRNHLKKESSKTRTRKNSKSVRRGRRHGLKGKRGSEKSETCRRKKNSYIRMRRKNFEKKLKDNSEPKNVRSVDRKHRRTSSSRHRKIKRDLNHLGKGMIAQLMRTTTRDPKKKKPGDQGVEYSEYYSDNDNILSPDMKVRSKLNEEGKNLAGGRIRSIREIGDDNLLQEYYDNFKNDRFIEEEVERPKRNDQKSVKIMEDPSEYVDSSYRPEIAANGNFENERIPEYFGNYNYPSGPNGKAAYNPSAGIFGLRQATPSQFFPRPSANFNKNLRNIYSPVANNLNANSLISDVQRIAPGQRRFPENTLSQLGKPDLDRNKLVPYYSIGESSSARTFNSLTNPAAFSAPNLSGRIAKSSGGVAVSVPENGRVLKLTSAAFGTGNSGLSNSISAHFLPSSRNSGLATPIRGTSLAPVSLKSSLTTGDSELRNINPEAAYFGRHDIPENLQGPDQIAAVVSRETLAKGSADKNESSSANCTTKSEAQSSTQSSASSELNDSKKHVSGKAVEHVEYNLLPMTSSSSQAPLTLRPGGPKPINSTNMTKETKAAASEILNEIIGELEELRIENPKDEQKEGLPCKLTGSWVTSKAGVRIDMKVTNHSVVVTLDYLTPPITTEGLLNVTWNVTGFAPFKRGGPFTLLATNNHTKTLAVFVGACKVCQGIDTIEGSWTVSREPRDCRDFQMSTSIFNEIFRRTRLYSAIKEKQMKHEAQTTINPNSNSSAAGFTSLVQEEPVNLAKSHNQTS